MISLGVNDAAALSRAVQPGEVGVLERKRRKLEKEATKQ